MGIERVLLQTIKFDLHVEHPYTFLLQYQKVIFHVFHFCNTFILF